MTRENLKDYLFTDEESGEEFFVECESLDKAWEIVREYFEEDYVNYLATYSPEEADILGLDTY